MIQIFKKESNVAKRTLYQVGDIEAYSGATINYSKLREETILLLNKKKFTIDDIYTLAVFLNSTAFNKNSPIVRTSIAEYSLKTLTNYLDIKEAYITTDPEILTIARIARCLTPECSLMIQTYSIEAKILLFPFDFEKYSFYNAYIILPVEKRLEWLKVVIKSEDKWVIKGNVVANRFSEIAKNFFKSNLRPQLDESSPLGGKKF